MLGEFAKYKAIISAYGVDDPTVATEYADNIGDYEYYPEASSAAEYGLKIFTGKHNINPDEPELKYISFENYGCMLMNAHNAVKTEYGFIRKMNDTHQEQVADGGIVQGMGGIT